MILLAAIFLAGYVWTWDVTLRYDDPTDGLLQIERERWTMRVGTGSILSAERLYLGTLIDGTLVPASGLKPEIVKGTVEADGTLQLKDAWSDPACARVLKRLLNPEKKLDDRVADWPVLRRAILREPEARLPGTGTLVRLRVDITLHSARLGGKDILTSKNPTPAPPQGEGSS